MSAGATQKQAVVEALDVVVTMGQAMVVDTVLARLTFSTDHPVPKDVGHLAANFSLSEFLCLLLTSCDGFQKGCVDFPHIYLHHLETVENNMTLQFIYSSASRAGFSAFGYNQHVSLCSIL